MEGCSTPGLTMDATIRRGAAALLYAGLCLLMWAGRDATAGQPEYAAGPQDVLTITVWEQAALSGKFTVGTDGNISFPLLGTIKVAGLTSRAIETLLRTRLGDGYLKNPQVTVEVTQFLSQRIFVMGEVRTPGAVALTGEVTLLEALTRAGGVTENAGGELLLLRGDRAAGAATAPLTAGARGVTELARVSIGDLRSGAFSQNIPLKDGDSIFVPRTEFIYVLGQVNRPGAYPLEPGMTVLRAISLAGGVTRVGSTGRVKIGRIVAGKNTEVKAKLSDVVKAGDTITVGTRII
jgi:polysaccharide biosynthesis/export protein